MVARVRARREVLSIEHKIEYAVAQIAWWRRRQAVLEEELRGAEAVGRGIMANYWKKKRRKDRAGDAAQARAERLLK